MRPLSPAFGQTREALHRLAVYVISPAQRMTNGEIILQATPGGFGTSALPDGQIRVEGTDLVVERDGTATRAPITTLNAMAALVGITPDVGQQAQFDVPPHGDLDEPLTVDPRAAEALAAWYRFTTEHLVALRDAAAPENDVTPVRLWPEHFDAAIDLGAESTGHRATYGGSPGDASHPEPYLYASPWAGRIDDFFADPHFSGASLSYDEILSGADPGAFFREARCRIAGHRSWS
jgi:hypothetical protein